MLTVPFISFVLLIFVTLVAVPCNLIAMPLLRLLGRFRPQARSPLLLLLVAAPWLLGAGVLISSVVDVFFGACETGNICLWNEDPRAVSVWTLLLIAPLLGGICIIGARLGGQLIRSNRAVRALGYTSLHDTGDDVRIIDSAVPLAFAAHGRVFVSHGLRTALQPTHFRAVLLHERAHLQRSDGICQIFARALSCMLIPPIRRRVLDALTLANEQSCDEVAGQAVGRLHVAAAIVAVERLNRGTSAGLCPAFAETFVPDRVRSLLAPELPAWRSAAVYASVMCGLLLVFVLGDLLYYTGMELLYPSILS